MNRRTNMTIVTGACVALLGAVLVFAYGRSVQAGSGSQTLTQAFVARTHVPAGTKWEDAVESFQKQAVPANVRPSNAVVGQLPGRTTVRSIARGEIVTSAQFGAEGRGTAGALEVPPGKNGVSVSMPVPQGVARYVQPGALINVYATFKGAATGPEANAPTTKLILTNVQVLANRAHEQGAESAAPAGPGGEILLTLALSPDDAEKMIYAKENGTLWFGLVRPGDAPATTPGRTPRTALR